MEKSPDPVAQFAIVFAIIQNLSKFFFKNEPGIREIEPSLRQKLLPLRFVKLDIYQNDPCNVPSWKAVQDGVVTVPDCSLPASPMVPNHYAPN